MLLSLKKSIGILGGLCQELEVYICFISHLYPENYNTLLKEMKEDLNKWKDTQVL